MKQLIARSVFVAVVVLCFVGAESQASASPITLGQWYEFRFVGPGSFGTACTSAFCFPGVNSVFAPDSPWTFTSSQSVVVRLTDGFPAGDSFTLFDFGSLVGSTPLVGISVGCGNNPAVCISDPAMSQGVFVLAAGAHSLTIRADNVPFGTGAGFFRVDPMPEPATLLLLGTGVVGVVIKTKRRFKSRDKQRQARRA